MTNRERLLAVFQKQTPEVVPFAPDLTYYYGVHVPNPVYQYGATDAAPAPEEAARRFIDFHREHHCIPYYQYETNVFRAGYGPGVTVEGVPEGDRQISRLKLGGRSLVKITEYSAISHSSAPLKYPVETVEDLRLLREIIPHTVCIDTSDRWDQMNAWFGDLGYPICAAPRSPLPALLTDWVGIENAVYLLEDEPDLCRAVCAAIARANDRPFEILCRGRAPLIHFCDNLSAGVIAGWWDEWAADYYQQRVQQLHAAGKYCVSHLDGTLSGMITRLARTGLDGIESITPAPVGDLTLEEVEGQLAGHDTVIWGGVPGAMFCPPFAWDDIRRQVDTLQQLRRHGRRVVVSSADQVPPDGDIGLVRRIGEYLETTAN